MPRLVRLYLKDILTAIERIQLLMASLDELAFKAGALETDGIMFNLMTIGEAAKNIPTDVRDLMADIQWTDIARFRDFVVHHYFGLDMNRVWSIVTVDLPTLKQQVETLLPKVED